MRVIDESIEMLPTTRARHSKVQLGSEEDRQVRFLGEEGQQRLRRLKVGVVGAGGNGAPIVMQLAHLGVGEIVTVDPDIVESSNRNRVPEARPDDDGEVAKVDVAKRYASRVRPETAVLAVAEPIEETWELLRDCDVIFGGTDDLSSRLVLNRLATQYFVPLIDTGVEIEVVKGNVRTIASRVSVIRPGEKCLEALGFTSEEAARQELSIRRRPAYVQDEPAASAMPANLLVASVGGIEFLKLVHGLLGGSRTDRYFAYLGRSGELRACEATGGDCDLCDEFAGLGDARPLPLVGPTRRGSRPRFVCPRLSAFPRYSSTSRVTQDPTLAIWLNPSMRWRQSWITRGYRS
ncbi:MAG: ThiF family adenylyltransferase [Actinobacteria bacterium]|nr:ThiF family adenylyltransferase [Actinomycetota bacterium]